MEKNLQNKEAKEKFKKLVNDIKVCMFITNNPESDHTRPMFTIEVEEDDSLWFFTDSRSLKVEEVKGDKNVHLVYAHPGKESYLDVWGSATINTDKKNIKDKWTPLMKAWFQDGVDDPNLCLLKVKPQNVYYWDAEHGKMISIL
ncbi:MAG: pyridoxamine 5'-phosphate oxidase family protein, partial [Flavisolibacter sp.]